MAGGRVVTGLPVRIVAPAIQGAVLIQREREPVDISDRVFVLIGGGEFVPAGADGDDRACDRQADGSRITLVRSAVMPQRRYFVIAPRQTVPAESSATLCAGPAAICTTLVSGTSGVEAVSNRFTCTA